LERLSNVAEADTVVVATSEAQGNKAIVELCNNKGIPCFQGSEENVLNRYAECAREFSFCHVVRCTGDNPFHDPIEINNLIREHIRAEADYSSNTAALPGGVGAEVFKAEILFRIEQLAIEADHFEHVNEYILQHPAQFRIHKVSAYQLELARHDFSLTVDTEDEFVFAEKVLKEMAMRNITRLADAVDIVAQLCQEKTA